MDEGTSDFQVDEKFKSESKGEVAGGRGELKLFAAQFDTDQKEKERGHGSQLRNLEREIGESMFEDERDFTIDSTLQRSHFLQRNGSL